MPIALTTPNLLREVTLLPTVCVPLVIPVRMVGRVMRVLPTNTKHWVIHYVEIARQILHLLRPAHL